MSGPETITITLDAGYMRHAEATIHNSPLIAQGLIEAMRKSAMELSHILSHELPVRLTQRIADRDEIRYSEEVWQHGEKL